MSPNFKDTVGQWRIALLQWRYLQGEPFISRNVIRLVHGCCWPDGYFAHY